MTNANKAFAGQVAPSILDVQKEAKNQGINNAYGGHYNHAFFWCVSESVLLLDVMVQVYFFHIPVVERERERE